jgi:hypothetical protein
VTFGEASMYDVQELPSDVGGYIDTIRGVVPGNISLSTFPCAGLFWVVR